MSRQKRAASSLSPIGYSIEETITMTGLCRASIYNEINAKRLKTFMVGRRRLISPDALRNWVQEKEKETELKSSVRL